MLFSFTLATNILRKRIDLDKQSVLFDEQFIQITSDNRCDFFLVSCESELLADTVRLRGR